MARSRSVSRHPSVRRRKDESAATAAASPTRSRSRSASGAPPSRRASKRRPRSRSRSPPARHRRERAPSPSLTTSAGVIAGIGLAALVVCKLWPKSSSGKSTEREDRRGDGYQRRRSAGEEQRGRDGERRAIRRQPSYVDERDYGQARYVSRGEEERRYSREAERRRVESRGWAGDDARRQMQPGAGYGRRYS